MKIIEFTQNLTIAVNNEEVELLEKFEIGPLAKSTLTEHEAVIANNLTVKGVLLRFNDNGRLYYKRSN